MEVWLEFMKSYKDHNEARLCFIEPVLKGRVKVGGELQKDLIHFSYHIAIMHIPWQQLPIHGTGQLVW